MPVDLSGENKLSTQFNLIQMAGEELVVVVFVYVWCVERVSTLDLVKNGKMKIFHLMQHVRSRLLLLNAHCSAFVHTQFNCLSPFFFRFFSTKCEQTKR